MYMSEEEFRQLRTQIYLTPDQKRRLSERAQREGTTMAELIRKAVDEYLRHGDLEAVLKRTFGSMPDLEVPPRSEWNREF
jgi:hypothetical protein